MKKIHVIATTRRGTTPPGVSHRTPLARGELCSLEPSSPQSGPAKNVQGFSWVMS